MSLFEAGYTPKGMRQPRQAPKRGQAGAGRPLGAAVTGRAAAP